MSAASPIQRSVALEPVNVPAGAGAQIGQALQQIGAEGMDFATIQQRAADQHDLVQARLGATNELNDLQDKYRTDTAPDTMAQRFQADADAIGQKYGKNLQGPVADQFAESYGLMSGSRLANIKDIAFGRKQDQAVADLDQLSETSARSAAYAANPAERISAITNYTQSVDGLVRTGMLAPEQAQKREQSFDERLALYQGKRDVFVNPQSALKDLKDPNYLPSLDPIARDELLNSADAEIRTREREARMAREQAKVEAALAAQDLHEAASAGTPVAQSVIDHAVATARASGDARSVQRVTGLIQGIGFANAMRGASPREVDQGIESLTAKANASGATPELAQALTTATAFKEKMNTALAHDPLGWADRQGVITLQPLALNGADAPAAFANRVKQAQDVSRRYGVPFQPLTQAEGATLKAALDSSDPTARLNVLRNVINGFGSNALPVLSKIGASDPSLANAAALMASGSAHEGAARDVLTGKHLLGDKANETLRPSGSALNYGRIPQMMSAYAFLPDSRTAVLDGASAIYAARAQRQGLIGADVANGGAAGELYNRSLQEAAGARFEADGTQWGGIGTYRGAPSLVPSDIKHDDFEDIAHQFNAGDLARASLNHQPPKWEGGTAPDDVMRHTWMISAGNGVYGLSATDPRKGPPQFVTDGSGQPFRFRYGAALVSMQARQKAGR